MLTVMEKTGDITLMLSGNTTAAHQLMEATPKLACIQVSIVNSTDDLVATIIKGDCSETAGLDIQTTARPILYNGSRYVITSESWFRKGTG
jgi:hypothetical protein